MAACGESGGMCRLAGSRAAKRLGFEDKFRVTACCCGDMGVYGMYLLNR